MRAGHEVIHISRLCDGLPEVEELNGVNHLRIRGAESCTSSLLFKTREFSYVWRVRKILPLADILITHAFWAPLLLNQKNTENYMCMWEGILRGQMRFYQKAVRLQAPSRVVANAISKELTDGDDRVLTIPYPLPFSTDQQEPFEQRPKRVLYAGRIHPEKGCSNWYVPGKDYRMRYKKMDPQASWALEGRTGWRRAQIFGKGKV